MKPVNLDSKPCSPVSSNCVIWQGPDIPCINLCKGDTVSDVVAKLAEELCNILDTLNVENYDLTCFGVDNCGPDDFEALINFLIQKICELEGISPEQVSAEGGCPTDCLVTVADCFVVNGQTTMSLLDYVHAIGNTVCTLINDIAALDIKVDNLIERVTLLEQKEDPTFTLPSFNSCLLGSVQPIDTILQNLETEYCSLIDATGTPGELALVKDRQCVADSDLSRANPSNAMSVEYSGTWITPVNTLADSLNNLWITLCDLRDQVIETVTVDVDDTATVDMSITPGPNYVITANISDTGWHDLLGFDYMLAPPQARRIGNVIYFRGNILVPLQDTTEGFIPLEQEGQSKNYEESILVTPSTTGAGSVNLDTSTGGVYFNSELNVIPPAVLDIGTTPLDNSYRLTYKIGARRVLVNQDGFPTNLISTLLFSVAGGITLLPDGKLLLTTLRDGEESSISQYQDPHSFNTSHLNTIVSHVRTGEYVPSYDGPNSTLHSNPLPGTQNATLDFSLTGHSSSPQTPLNFVYRMTVNANDITQIGGFSWNLEGLTAYVAP